MKSIVLTIFFCNFLLASSTRPVFLSFEEGISWESFFKGGFRPHHVNDGSKFCREFDICLTLSAGDATEAMILSPGDAFFSIAADQTILKFRYSARGALSVEEAKARFSKFKKIFSDFIDESRLGTITFLEAKRSYDYDSSQILAQFGDWNIWYILDPSYHELQYPQPPITEWKPFRERVLIVWRGERKKFTQDREGKITPPPGYEHISLEPHQVAEFAQGYVSDVTMGQRQSDRWVSQSSEMQEITGDRGEREGRPSYLWLVAGLLLVGLLFFLPRNSKV